MNKSISIPVLMYHDISLNKTNKDIVSLEEFETHIKTINSLGYKSFCLKDLKNLKKKSLIITFDDGYESTYKYAMPILNKYNFQATCFIVSNNINKFNDWDYINDENTKSKLMSADQIKEWKNNNHEIGSHASDHVNLKNLNYEEKLKSISNPISFFKKNFNLDLISFCYPYGSYDNECLEIVKKYYKFAVTTKRSRYKEKFNDYEIPRVPISKKTSRFKLLLKLLTFYEDIKYKH